MSAAEVVVQPAVNSTFAEVIDLARFTDLLEEAVLLSRIDLGTTAVLHAVHPVHGKMVLVNTHGEKHAVMYV